MNGSEREVRWPQELPQTTIGSNKLIDLPNSSKQDLVLFSSSPAYSSLKKLIEMMLVEFRDDAVRLPVHKKDERLAALDLASAAEQIYLRLIEKMTYLVEEEIGHAKSKDADAAMQDRDYIESVLFHQINQGR